MKALKTIRSALLLAIASSVALASGSAAEGEAAQIEALYAPLLEQYTRDVPSLVQVRVDYRGLLGQPRWQQLLDYLERVDLLALQTREERLAFWINAYNILAIDLVLSNLPVESIKDVGSLLFPVWGRRAGTIGGNAFSLDEIEHRILRPMGEPRVHAAVVCASISCPALRREPFVADRIDEQLDDSLRGWLANRGKGSRLDRPGRMLYLSKVFDWFDEDFEAKGGVVRFVLPYLSESDGRWVRDHLDELRLDYLDYDWALND